MGSIMAQILHQLYFQIKLFFEFLFDRSNGLSRRQKRRYRQSATPVSLWGGVGLGGVMLIWNWQLLLATVAAMGVLMVLFQFPFDRWFVYWRQYQGKINRSQWRLFMALGGSAVAGIGTYWGLQLWESIENHWLASSLVVQGIILTLLLGLQLSKSLLNEGDSKTSHQFSSSMENLTADNPLKRLMAIRYLTQLADQGRLQQEELKRVSESFRLLFSIETEPMVRQGLLECLQTLQLHQCWYKWEYKGSQPLQRLQKTKKVSETLIDRI